MYHVVVLLHSFFRDHVYIFLLYMSSLNIVDLSIFSIHYSPLTDRLKFIHSISSKLKVPVDIITEQQVAYSASDFHDLTDLSFLRYSVEYISDYLLLHLLFLSSGNDIKKFDKRCYLQHLAFPHSFQDSFVSQAIGSYSKANYELCCQHYFAISSFLKSKNQFCLILEDDSLLLEDINSFKAILSCVDFVHNDAPMYVDVSNSLGLIALYDRHQPFAANKPRLVPVLPGQTRCASAYIINKLAAIEILKFHQFVLPIDWHLSFCLRKQMVHTFWSSPALFLQGSETDLLVSNQNQRNL